MKLVTERLSAPYYLDTETCGLHGVAVLIQYALGDGPIHIHEIWRRPVQETLDLIAAFANHPGGVVTFNATFDWFHLNKLYNIFVRLKDKEAWPDVKECAMVELAARDGVCVKPHHTLDLFLHARKTAYQSTMERGDIAIRRVPAQLAADLARELEKRVPLNPIYFARREDKTAPQWRVKQSRDYETKQIVEGFYDVVLGFAPSAALKALAVDALKVPQNEVTTYEAVSVDKRFQPVEYGYAPFAPPNEPRGWPAMVEFHITHWAVSEMAREYAKKDIVYLRDLDKFFGFPAMDDDDSVLACQVAAVRWKGFRVDLEKLRVLLAKTQKLTETAPTAPRNVMAWISQVMSPTEKALVHSTTKNTLKEIATWRKLAPGYVCDKPEMHTADTAGATCDELHAAPTVPHPAAERARMVANARAAEKEVDLYRKLLFAGRFHPSFKIIGALSGRMAGADDLNPQGIKRTNYVRDAFTLAFDGEQLDGGDMKSFEAVLAEAEYKDPNLRRDLLSGKKIHGLFGTKLFPDMEYDEILATEHTTDDRYTTSKSGVFALIYGGDAKTLHNKQGIPLGTAEAAYAGFMADYPEVENARKKVFDAFCSMSQPVPHGPVLWREPADFVESMLGFRRYFTLENRICRALFDLAQKPLPHWRDIKAKVKRRDRFQTMSGAAQSALFGAAFGIQSANMRAAANHKIQSTGAQITKHLQRRIWDLQPAGICTWVVRTLNIHDEVNVACKPEISERISEIVKEVIESYREMVPLIAIGWKRNMASWGSK